MTQLIVVNGAILQCTLGSTPSSLIVTSQTKTKAIGKAVATINDNNLSNLGTFGTCSFLQGPCVPIPSMWTPYSTKCKCNYHNTLIKTSQMVCGNGGTISITNAAQIKVKTY